LDFYCFKNGPVVCCCIQLITLAAYLGVKELDTGLAPPNLWDIPADKQRMGEEHPLQVYFSFSLGMLELL
jgi:uncharacterized lipoprotein NlpE involved in copper resistance